MCYPVADPVAGPNNSIDFNEGDSENDEPPQDYAAASSSDSDSGDEPNEQRFIRSHFWINDAELASRDSTTVNIRERVLCMNAELLCIATDGGLPTTGARPRVSKQARSIAETIVTRWSSIADGLRTRLTAQRIIWQSRRAHRIDQRPIVSAAESAADAEVSGERTGERRDENLSVQWSLRPDGVFAGSTVRDGVSQGTIVEIHRLQWDEWALMEPYDRLSIVEVPGGSE